jgi:hypothetical protein
MSGFQIYLSDDTYISRFHVMSRFSGTYAYRMFLIVCNDMSNCVVFANRLPFCPCKLPWLESMLQKLLTLFIHMYINLCLEERDVYKTIIATRNTQNRAHISVVCKG